MAFVVLRRTELNVTIFHLLRPSCGFRGFWAAGAFTHLSAVPLERGNMPFVPATANSHISQPRHKSFQTTPLEALGQLCVTMQARLRVCLDSTDAGFGKNHFRSPL
jgi:hypothetical protein